MAYPPLTGLRGCGISSKDIRGPWQSVLGRRLGTYGVFVFESANVHVVLLAAASIVCYSPDDYTVLAVEFFLDSYIAYLYRVECVK